MKKLLLLLIITVSSIYAKSCMTDIYFGNGVWNEEEEGQEGRDELKFFMQYRANSRLDIQKEGIDYDFKHAYNPSQGTTNDLLETFYQLKESGQISNGYFQWIFTLLNRDESIEPYQKLQDIVRTHNEDTFYMFTKYDNESFKKKHNVLLVAHSQGNLFGNKMYTLMSDTQKKKFRMVSVATPANHVAGYVNGGPYVTATGDYVIRPIPGSLPSNIAGFGHTFIGTYLNIDGAGVPGDGSNNAPKIIGVHVKSAYNNLIQTTSCTEYKFTKISMPSYGEIKVEGRVINAYFYEDIGTINLEKRDATWSTSQQKYVCGENDSEYNIEYGPIFGKGYWTTYSPYTAKDNKWLPGTINNKSTLDSRSHITDDIIFGQRCVTVSLEEGKELYDLIEANISPL